MRASHAIAVALLAGACRHGPVPGPPYVTARPTEATDTVTVRVGPRLDAGHGVRGRVLDGASGTPLAGALVELSPRLRAARTAADGTFEFAPVPPGPYRLSVRRIGYLASTRGRLELPANSSAEVRVAMARVDLWIPEAAFVCVEAPRRPWWRFWR